MSNCSQLWNTYQPSARALPFPESGSGTYLRDMFGYLATPGRTSDLGDASGALGPFRGSDARLSDAEIRAALVVDGAISHHDGLLMQEVECWRGYVRADYLCVSQGVLSVIEIKSDRDTLRRFPEQVRVYSAVADRVTLVVGWSLAARVLRDAPWWWDVVLAERSTTSAVRFVPLRDGAPNPEVAEQALAAMLPVDDLRRLARASGITDRLRGRPLRELVATRVSAHDLRAAIGRWLTRLSLGRATD
jgi:hypothetical protein